VFITKNQFHNWISKLARIWHIFRKLVYFWLFLGAAVKAFLSPDAACTGALKKSQK
jgi:hypothetical protein